VSETNINLKRKGLILASVPLAAGLFFIGAVWYFFDRQHVRMEHQRTELAINSGISQSEKLLTDASKFALAFTYARQANLLDAYNHHAEDCKQKLAEVQQLLTDPAQIKEAERMQQLFAELCGVLDRETAQSSDVTDSRLMNAPLEASVKRLFDGYEAAASHLKAQHPVDASAPDRIDISWMEYAILAAAVVNVAVTVAWTLRFSSVVTRRLSVLTDNASRLARREPLNPPIQGSDELVRLDRLFHDMARTIEAAAKRERDILDNAVDVICSLNKNFEFVAVSPSAERAWGYAPRELIGRSITEFVHESDADASHAWLADARSGKESKFENNMVTKDGAVVSALWSINYSVEEQAYFCVAHDITDRIRAEELLKDSEARVRLIIESMPVGLLIVDERGYIEMTNVQTDVMFGYSYEDLLGEHLSILFADQFANRPDSLSEVVAKFSGRVTDLDARRPDGSTLQVEFSLTEFTLHGTKKILAVMMDVSERHAVERLKKQLVAMVSHDLRTPLTMIQNTLMILGAQYLGTLEPKAAQLVQAAESETERLIEMINSLLDIEKMQSGTLEMDMTPISLDSIISRSVTVVAHAAEKQRVALEAGLTGCEVVADGAKLVQVLINLLANAIKFSPRDGKVSVNCEQDGDWLQIAVSDQGRGIPSSQTELIFERFHQVEVSDRTEKGGTGLGLAICKSIVEAHGGSIGVKSEVGHGSTFWFKIPSPEQ